MNKQAFLNLIKNPKDISSKDLNGLEEVIANFPFCQTAHILAAKGSSDQGLMLSEEKVRKAAAYTAERKNLKNILINESVIEKSESKPDSIQAPSIKIISKESVISGTTDKTELIKEIKDLVSEEAKKVVEDKKIKENFRTTSINEKFFSELQENLKSLRSLKEKVAKEKTSEEILKEKIDLIKEVESPKKEIKLAETNPVKTIIEKEKEEPSIIKNSLQQDPIKDHSKEINLYSSRLDEVLEKDNVVGPFNSEAEILLNYLSFLEDHKNLALKDKKKTEEIIEKFIKKDPSMPYLNSASLPQEQEDKASQSYQLKGSLISENMANIYILQGKKDKALEIYKQLILKNPEKRAYFETLIEKIKRN